MSCAQKKFLFTVGNMYFNSKFVFEILPPPPPRMNPLIGTYTLYIMLYRYLVLV